MTTALCFHCGSTKFGALCPCPECHQGPTGNIQLDITFSDHHYSVATLESFGSVIRAIARQTGDQELRFWCFLRYVTDHHPDILQVKLEPELEARTGMLLEQLSLPPITLRKPVKSLLGKAILALAGLAIIIAIYAYFFR